MAGDNVQGRCLNDSRHRDFSKGRGRRRKSCFPPEKPMKPGWTTQLRTCPQGEKAPVADASLSCERRADKHSLLSKSLGDSNNLRL